METTLLGRRKAARDRHDRAWETSPEGRGPEFESELAATVEELEAIAIAAAAAVRGGDVEVAKSWRYVGDAWFDLGRVRGNPAYTQALAAFERGQAALAGVSGLLEHAILTVGKANSNLGLAGGRDGTLLRRAITLYEEALPTIRAELPEARAGVERSLGQARTMLTVASTYARMEQGYGQLESAKQALKNVEHEPGETVEDRQTRLMMGSLISGDAVVAQVKNAIAGFMSASGNDENRDRRAASLAQLSQSLNKLRVVAQTNPEAVREAEQKLGDLSLLRQQLFAGLEAGRVRPVRRIQLEEVLDEIEHILMTKADDLLAIQASLNRIQQLMSRVMALNPEGLDERLAGLHQAVKEEAARPGQSPHDAEESRRLFAASARLGPDLQAAVSAGAPALHEPRLRVLAVEAQRHLRRHNLMIAEPLWDCPKVVRQPDHLFFAGTLKLERRLAVSCTERGISLLGYPKGGDEGQLRWDQLRSAGAAVFDVSGEPGSTLAQTYYELGLAMSLGLPVALLAQEGQRLPFDVEESPIFLRNDGHDDDRLVAAVDLAYGRPYRGEPNVSMSETLATAIHFAEADAVAPGHARVALEMARQAHAARDATLLMSTLQTLMNLLPGRRLQLFHPSHPPQYPQPGAHRLFHVMPFSEPWSQAAMHAAEAGCVRSGAAYVRGDRPPTARVLRSIWNEVGLATHLLADLTGFNVNVAFELGLAHARGKQTLLLVRGADGKAGVFPAIAKLQIRPYQNDGQLTALVARFVI